MKHYFRSLFNQANPTEEPTPSEALNKANTLLAFTKQFLKEKPLEVFIPASALLIIGISCIGLSLVRHDTSHVLSQQLLQAKHTQAISAQLGDIRDQLQSLESSPQSSEAFKESLVKINTDIGSVQQSIASMKDDMDSQMTELKKEVNNNPNMKQYLDPKVLPFKVISIDVLSQQPFASVSYEDHITSLTIGDALAGWILDKADYASATAEFKNAKDQYVKVIVEG